LCETVTRDAFEELTRDLLDRCVEPVRQAMADAGRNPEQLDEVILVGGSTRMPAVQALVRQLTGGKEPNMSVNPDEVVAMGAAIQAAVLTGQGPDVVLLDVIPLSLGLETLGGVMTKVIERNTTIPVRHTEVFSTAEDNQSAVTIVVLQGERERAGDNRVIGRFLLEDIRPALRGVPQIEVTFDIDVNGMLNVAARDQHTGAEQTITITKTTNLDRVEVDRMVTDAHRNQDEDGEVRRLIDMRNELESVAYLVERRLDELEDEVPVHDKARGETLLAQARQAMENQAPLDRIESMNAELREIAKDLVTRGSRARIGAPDRLVGDDVIDVEPQSR
jgi:molecular chaperone DnaK